MLAIISFRLMSQPVTQPFIQTSGAVSLLGKQTWTNCHAHGFPLTKKQPFTVAVKNPWNLDIGSGGSSVALPQLFAAGLVEWLPYRNIPDHGWHCHSPTRLFLRLSQDSSPLMSCFSFRNDRLRFPALTSGPMGKKGRRLCTFTCSHERL